MNNINAFAFQKAQAAAARLWAFGSAQFPFSNGAPIQTSIEQEVTDTAIDFAIHVRRLLDNHAKGSSFQLDAPFRNWDPANGLKKVTDLRDALNHIVHATSFHVGFEHLPAESSNIEGGAIGVIYLQARTDRRGEALIDVFALSSCFFRHVMPTLVARSAPTAH